MFGTKALESGGQLMNGRLSVVLLVFLSLPAGLILAQVDESTVTPEARRAAWRLAIETASEATAEEVEQIYLNVLRASGARAGTGLEPRAAAIPPGNLRFEEGIDVAEVFNDPTFKTNLEFLNSKAQDDTKIINGQPVSTQEYSDVVFVRSDCCSCTGTLISPNVVVTAAHCLENTQVREIRIGSNFRSGNSFRVKPNGQIPHPQYRFPSNDIALLILQERVPPSVAMPRAIATAEQIAAARLGRAIGFGITETGQSGIKMMADIPFIRNDCSSGSFGCRGKEMVLGRGESDTCNGDSGGPLMVQVGNDYLLAGVTSRAIATSGTIIINGQRYACGYGGIYSNVRAHLDSFVEPAIRNHGGDPIGDVPQAEPIEPGSGGSELKPEVAEALNKLRAAIDQLENAIK
jgi:hypothetical protein